MPSLNEVTRNTAWALIVLEALWSIYWLVSMLIIQISTDDTNHGFDYRFSIVIIALHAVSPIALVGVMNEHHQYSAMTAWFFVFAIMTDTWSLLDAALHLSRSENFPAWRLVIGAASWAFALGILTLAWYLIAVIRLGGHPSATAARKAASRGSNKTGAKEPLLAYADASISVVAHAEKQK